MFLFSSFSFLFSFFFPQQFDVCLFSDSSVNSGHVNDFSQIPMMQPQILPERAVTPPNEPDPFQEHIRRESAELPSKVVIPDNAETNTSEADDDGSYLVWICFVLVCLFAWFLNQKISYRIFCLYS